MNNPKFRAKEKILHRFSEAEQAENGHKLAEKYSTLLANKELAKQSASEFRGIIKDNEDDCNAIKQAIVKGEETRYVDIHIEFNSPKHGYKRATRVDTGDEVWQREMTPEELQMLQGDLFPDGKERVISSGSGTVDDPYVFTDADEFAQKQLTEGVQDVSDLFENTDKTIVEEAESDGTTD